MLRRQAGSAPLRASTLGRNREPPMRKASIGCVLGSVAATLSMLSVSLSSAPFTPAIVVNLLSVPLALVAITMGAWRTGFLTLYWALCAALALPNVLSTVRVDYLLVLLHLLGVGASVALFVQHRRSLGVTGNGT